MSEIILLSSVRLSFPHLIEPQRNKTETGADRITWSADFIMPQDHVGFQQFMQRVAAVAGEKWGTNANAVLQMVQADRKSRCYGSGAEKVDKKTFQPYSGYQGMVYVTAIANRPPQVIQADGKPVDPSNTMGYQMLTRAMYGGCYVNAAVKPWAQENKHGRAVRCDLIAVQFAKDGEAFGDGAPDASGLFGAVAAPAAAAAPNPFAPAPQAAAPAFNPFAPQ